MVQLENKISGHGSQGACHQDKMIGGTLPAVRKVTLTMTRHQLQSKVGGYPRHIGCQEKGKKVSERNKKIVVLLGNDLSACRCSLK
jgi:hypothetical protein